MAIPAKRFGFLLVKIKERYKDDSLSISGAGEKVRKLIDEHLVSLGINPKIPPVELLSPNFVQQLCSANCGGRSESSTFGEIRPRWRICVASYRTSWS